MKSCRKQGRDKKHCIPNASQQEDNTVWRTTDSAHTPEKNHTECVFKNTLIHLFHFYFPFIFWKTERWLKISLREILTDEVGSSVDNSFFCLRHTQNSGVLYNQWNMAWCLWSQEYSAVEEPVWNLTPMATVFMNGEGGVLVVRLVPLQEETRALAVSPLYKPRTALTRTCPCWHLHLWLPASRTVRKQISVA